MGGTDMTNSVMPSGGSSITGSTGFTSCQGLRVCPIRGWKRIMGYENLPLSQRRH